MNFVKIDQYVRPTKKWNPSLESNKKTFRYIDISSISQEEKLIIPNNEILVSDAPSRARQRIEAGDILVSTVRPNLNAVALVSDNLDGAIASTGFCVLRTDQKNLYNRYLFQWVRSPIFIESMVRQATGQSYPAVSDKIVKESLIPLPPLEEQKRIAAILDQADALRRLRQRAVDRFNTLGQAIFYEMFGDPLVNPKKWPQEKLGKLCKVVRGSSPRPQGDRRFFGGRIPRLMIADITRDRMWVTPRIDSLTEAGAVRSRLMAAGSLVIAVSGAVGLASILRVDACIHDGFVGLKDLDERLNTIFLYHFLTIQRSYNSSKGTGAIWINLTTDQVKNFDIPIPSKEYQEEFNRKLTNLDHLNIINRKALETTTNLFSSLQYRAFSGNL